MDDFEEKRLQLLYEQNLTHSIVVNKESDKGITKEFKQQLNCQLVNKFKGKCHEKHVGDFRYNEIVEYEDIKEIKIKRKDKEIVLNDSERKNFDIDRCFGCNNYMVPGINMKIRVKYEIKKVRKVNDKETEKKRKKSRVRGKGRVILMKCCICGVKVEFKGASSLINCGDGKKDKRETITKHMPLNTLPIIYDTNKVKPDIEKDGKAKIEKKKKKKKKNGLSELLKRKQQEKGEDGNDGDVNRLFSLLN